MDSDTKDRLRQWRVVYRLNMRIFIQVCSQNGRASFDMRVDWSASIPFIHTTQCASETQCVRAETVVVNSMHSVRHGVVPFNFWVLPAPCIPEGIDLWPIEIFNFNLRPTNKIYAIDHIHRIQDKIGRLRIETSTRRSKYINAIHGIYLADDGIFSMFETLTADNTTTYRPAYGTYERTAFMLDTCACATNIYAFVQSFKTHTFFDRRWAWDVRTSYVRHRSDDAFHLKDI